MEGQSWTDTNRAQLGPSEKSGAQWGGGPTTSASVADGGQGVSVQATGLRSSSVVSGLVSGSDGGPRVPARGVTSPPHFRISLWIRGLRMLLGACVSTRFPGAQRCQRLRGDSCEVT